MELTLWPVPWWVVTVFFVVVIIRAEAAQHERRTREASRNLERLRREWTR
jgi:hypothetical protein